MVPPAEVARLLPEGSAVETPALLIDLDILRANLTDMVERVHAAGVQLFPHAKTHRVPRIGQLQIELGADGLTVAKLTEAEAFADAGVTSIIVAYPIVGIRKLERAHALARRIDLALSTDSVVAARAMGQYFDDRDATIDVFLLVDSGLNRCGVPAPDAPAAALEIASIPGIRLRGILTHEGSVYTAQGGTQVAELSADAVELMTAVAQACRDAGVPIDVVSMGSSASVRSVAGAGGVDQVRPGIYAFNDLGQVALGQVETSSCAARVLATVVSNPAPGRACIDAGSKSLSLDVLPAYGAKLYPGHGLLLGAPGWRIDRLSEEHGWLRWAGEGEPTPLTIGATVEIIPNHICTVFSSLGEATMVQGGQVVDVWPGLPHGASR